MRRIIGIDPGYERLGLAVIEGTRGKEALIYSECFRTKGGDSFEGRLLLIGNYIEKIIKKYKPQILSIENLFINTNQKTAMRVAEVRGVIIFTGKKLGLQIAEYSPPQVKGAITSYGRSDKKQMAAMIPHLIVIPKSKTKILDDEYDAIALALTASAYNR